MHEISLVQGLLDQLHSIARENNAKQVLRVTMIIGPLSGVVVESFEFGFDILSRQDDLVRDAKLEIIIPEVTYRCSNCGQEEVTSRARPAQCAKCGDRILIATQGDDLILRQVEME